MVQRDQEKLRRNLSKYNNFVREKESKVSEGERIYEEERHYQRSIQKMLSDRREQMNRLSHAKVPLDTSHARRDY